MTMLRLESPIRFSDQDELICPDCGGSYTHQSRAVEDRAASADGYDAGWQGRGEAIFVSFECENGCTFRIVIGQHKGLTFIRYTDGVGVGQ